MFEATRALVSWAVLGKQLTPAVLDSPIGTRLFSPTSGYGGAPPRTGTRDLLRNYSRMPWLRAVVNKVGKSVSQTEWRLYTQPGAGGRAARPYRLQRLKSFETRERAVKQALRTDALREIENHPLIDLLEFGNPQFDGMVVLQVTQHHIDLTGEAFWLLEKNGLGMPVAVWPVPPDWVREFPTTSNPFYRVRLGRTEIDIPLTEMIPFIDPDPADPFSRGSGIAKSLGDELETDEFAARHLKSFFYNRARPDIIVSADNLNRSDTERMEQRWLESHKGFWQQFKPYFINRKIEVKEIGQSFESMQLIPLRKYERDTVIQVFGFPPEKFGIVNESKRSTISAADFFWTKDVVLPRIELIRRCLQRHLVPIFDDRVLLHYESPITEDHDYELSVMRAAPWAFTRGEWRRKAGELSAGEADDVFLLPLNSFERPLEGGATLPPTADAGGEEPPAAANENAYFDSLGRVVEIIEPEVIERTQEEVRRRLAPPES